MVKPIFDDSNSERARAPKEGGVVHPKQTPFNDIHLSLWRISADHRSHPVQLQITLTKLIVTLDVMLFTTTLHEALKLSLAHASNHLESSSL